MNEILGTIGVAAVRIAALEARIIELEAQLQKAQKIVASAVAWHSVSSGQDMDAYMMACHDLEAAVLEHGKVQP